MVQNVKRRFSTSPLTKAEAAGFSANIDYADALTNIKNAVNSLSECLPDGNSESSEIQFTRLQVGVHKLGAFLRAKGLNVSPVLSESRAAVALLMALSQEPESEETELTSDMTNVA